MNFLAMISRLFIALMMILMFSCESDKKKKGAITNPPTSSKAMVRVIHTSYDAPAVDVRVDEKIAISNLSYGGSSGYAALEAGLHNIKVSPNGQTSPVVIEANPNLQANKEYTVYAVGPLGSIAAIISEDNRTVNSQKAKIRFLHASPDAPPVDIKLNSGSGTRVFSNASFKGITQYVEVNEGNYTFVVTPAGGSTEVAVFNPIMLSKGIIYTVIAHGTLNNSQFPFAVRAFIDNNAGNQFSDLSRARDNVVAIHASSAALGKRNCSGK